MKIYTADRETGTIIDQFETIENAIKAIFDYAEEDGINGKYEPLLYDVVDENNCSLKDYPEAVFFWADECISYSMSLLILSLMLATNCVTSINEDKELIKNRQELIKHKRRYEKESYKLEQLIALAFTKAEEWKQECNPDDMARIQRSVAEIKEAKEDLESYNKEFNEKIIRAGIKEFDASQNFTNSTTENHINGVFRRGLEKTRNLIKICKDFFPIRIKITYTPN